MENKRNFDLEFDDNVGRKYAYGFDLDVMHPFMIKSFEPFFKNGNLLELGSFQGNFTKRFLPYFNDITCVEASGDALKVAKKLIGDKVKYVHGMFEDVSLPKKYDNIVFHEKKIHEYGGKIIANTDKSKRILKWKPRYTMNEGLKETFDWLKNKNK